MKQILTNLKASSNSVFTSNNGSLSINIINKNIIKVRYDIDSFKIEPVYLDANEALKPFNPEEKTEVSFIDFDNECTLSFNGFQIVVNKKNANILIKDNQSTIHGGELGTNDTVLPHNQFRLINDSCYFNFPLNDDDHFFGLGDKGGSPDRRGRRFSMFNRDSLGYDAEKSDPLYKSVPFFIKQNSKSNVICGLYFPESQIEYFDFGQESIFFYSIKVNGGPFEYYVFLGKDYKEILYGYCSITGFATLPPLFSFGFFGSSMNYLEAYNASERILKYFETIEKLDFPCEGLYASSGYLKADDGNRYAFIWNKRKFPDYESYLKALADRGYNLTMNIKPGILTTHPWYEELKEKGYFVKDNDGNPIVVFYWGGEASFVDFSNIEAKNWWKQKLIEVFISKGCNGIWNDNNECELEDPSLIAYKDRTLYPVKMAQTSVEAFEEYDNSIRPWVYSRSGYSTIQRFTRTWSGDNRSDFKTLKFNQYQSISLGLSGIPFYGHDIGGFYGPVPTEELLVRSSQSAVFSPRFVIHSWREDDKPTEPWTYKQSFETIRNFVIEHYRFMPYIYNLAIEANKTGTPLDRPLWLEYPNDKNVNYMSPVNLFGPSILKTLIVNKGETDLSVYLPLGDDWISSDNESLYKGGTTVNMHIEQDQIKYWVKTGSIIPTAPGLKSLRTGLFDKIEFLLYPPSTKDKDSITYTYFEDEGKHKLETKMYNTYKVNLSTSQVFFSIDEINLKEDKKRSLCFTLPRGFIFTSTKHNSITINTSQHENIVLEFTGKYNIAE